MDFALIKKEKSSSKTLNDQKDPLELMCVTHTMKTKFLNLSRLLKVWITFKKKKTQMFFEFFFEIFIIS